MSGCSRAAHARVGRAANRGGDVDRGEHAIGEDADAGAEREGLTHVVGDEDDGLAELALNPAELARASPRG